MPPYNGSGTFVLPVGNPVVTGTPISSSVENTNDTGFALGLTNCMTRDGQSPATADIPLGTNKITGLAPGTASTDAANLAQVQGSAARYLAIGGTANVLTGTATPAIAAYVAGQQFTFIPGATNTGSATIAIGPLAAKNIFYRGFALYNGEMVAGVPVEILYDGTQFNIISGVQPILGVPTATTSGTSAPYPNLPGWLRRITMTFASVSSTGGNSWRVQLGEAGGSYATTGYNGTSYLMSDAASPSVDDEPDGFGIKVGADAARVNGSIIMTVENPNTFIWTAIGTFSRSDAPRMLGCAGFINLAGVVDRVRLVTSGGDTLDNGAVNILLE